VLFDNDKEMKMGSKLSKFALLGCVVCALSGAATAQASAASFEASGTGKLQGNSLNSQSFTNNSGAFSCAKASLAGSATQLVSTDLKLTVQYESCTYFGFAIFPASPAEFDFHANGEVDLLNPFTFSLPAGGCKITVLAQNGLGSDTYENHSGKLIVKNHLYGMRYSSSGGLCGSSGSNMTTSGNFEVGLQGGTLSFTP
jgi:hypothetical protein